MFSKLKQNISNHLINLNGWRTNRKIVVIESDDWGSIRIPGKKEYELLKKKGIPVENSLYCKYDKIESNEDIEALLDVLSSVKNANGQFPILTANFVSSNPDFDQIRQNKFNTYHFEPIPKTYSKLNGHEKVLDLVLEGFQQQLILPQFHGRDHVNVPLWMELLKKDVNFKYAFDLGLWGLSQDVFPNMEKSIQATYDSTDLIYCWESIDIGLDLFEEIFGFNSQTFISNNFIWADELEELLFSRKVMHIQSMKYQLMPLNGVNRRIKKRKVMGETNQFGMTYGIRNCSFEPTGSIDTVDRTLNQVKNAFLLNKPAIISTHRINFSGGMDKKNRDNNLIKFKTLLTKIVTRWPEVSFIGSDKLNQLFLKNY